MYLTHEASEDKGIMCVCVMCVFYIGDIIQHDQLMIDVQPETSRSFIVQKVGDCGSPTVSTYMTNKRALDKAKDSRKAIDKVICRSPNFLYDMCSLMCLYDMCSLLDLRCPKSQGLVEFIP